MNLIKRKTETILKNALLLCCLVVNTLTAQEGGQPQPLLPTVTLLADKIGITAEVAKSPETCERGLMYRKTMADNAGMLFVFPEERCANFWMANTLIPLSIAFLDRTGEILEIRDMKPLDRTPILSQSIHVQYALEMNSGWFSINQVRVGTRLVPRDTTWDAILQSADYSKVKMTRRKISP